MRAQLGIGLHVLFVERVVAHACEHADATGHARWRVTGILDGGPRRLKEQALLRIEGSRFHGRDAEERRVKVLRIGELTATLHIVTGAAHRVRVQTLTAHVVIREADD